MATRLSASKASNDHQKADQSIVAMSGSSLDSLQLPATASRPTIEADHGKLIDSRTMMNSTSAT
jgi:hypothetical protein